MTSAATTVPTALSEPASHTLLPGVNYLRSQEPVAFRFIWVCHLHKPTCGKKIKEVAGTGKREFANGLKTKTV
jgi:hypothetical protein